MKEQGLLSFKGLARDRSDERTEIQRVPNWIHGPQSLYSRCDALHAASIPHQRVAIHTDHLHNLYVSQHVKRNTLD